MQNLMGPYLEQSKAMFDRLQEQLQKGALFPGMPGFPPALPAASRVQRPSPTIAA
jgi:hypothetical protein